VSKRTVLGQPRQFFAGRRADSLVPGEPIDDIDCCHLSVSRGPE
jgi:hypothetical protein